MPEHCLPRNFEYEREVPWGGGAIMKEVDAPVSFLVRGTMPRNSPPADPSGGVKVEPRALRPPRFKTPPPPLAYRPKMRTSSVDPATIDPSQIIEVMGTKFWLKDGFPVPMPSSDTERPPPRIGNPKQDLARPTPGVSKPTRGRHVPTQGSYSRKHVCPVQACGRAFTKRDHLNRHIKSLHQREEPDQMYFCPMPGCDKSFVRADNCERHRRRHESHRQEIFACAPEDEYKGVHLQNPVVVDPDAYNIKPFANIAISPLALDLWLFRERRRIAGFDVPYVGDCDKYFLAHPDERESALRGDPKWQWRMPPAGPDFKPIDSRCMKGTFKSEVPANTNTT